MKIKKRVFVGVIIALCMVIVGASYAVWVSNQTVSNNTITTGSVCTYDVTGSPINEEGIQPGESTAAATFNIDLENTTGAYDLTLTTTGSSTVDLQYWTVQINEEAAVAVTNGMVLETYATNESTTISLIFTLSDSAPTTEAGKTLQFNLGLVAQE